MPRIRQAQPVLPVKDVSAALRWFEQLGFRRRFQDRAEDPRYAGVGRDEVELHLQWHDAAEWEADVDRPVVRLVVDDVDALSAEFDAAGGALHRTPVTDTPWGTREFHVMDPDRNGLQFYRDRE